MTGKCLRAWFVSLTFPTCRSLPTFSEIRETVQYKLALVGRACLWRASCSYHTGHSSRETVLLLQSGQCLLGFDAMVLRDLERFSYILFFFKKFFLMCMGALPTCISVLFVHLVPSEARKCIRSPKNGDMNSCEDSGN